jgi:hypothetical protein
LVLNLGADEVKSGGNGGGTAKKRVFRRDFERMEVNLFDGPGSTMWEAGLFGLNLTYDPVSKEVKTDDISGNLVAIGGVTDGLVSFSQNSTALPVVGSNIGISDYSSSSPFADVNAVATFIQGEIDALNFGGPELTVTSDGTSLIFAYLTLPTTIGLTVGSGGASDPTPDASITAGLPGVIMVNAYT